MITIHVTQNVSDCHVKFQSSDTETFKLAIETLKSSIPACFRSYDPQARRWLIQGVAYDRLLRWASDARKTLPAQVEWEWTYAGDEEKRAWTPPPQQPRDAYAALHLLPSAPAELVKAAYRTLAQLHHPDHGGDDERMKKINAAYKRLAA